MEALERRVLGMLWEFDGFRMESVVKLCFEDFILDADTRQLLRENQEVRVSPRAFELLKMLIDERPRAVAKRALMERLWPDTYVAETNLASLVAEIREATGDRADAPRFTRTVHRFGYAFCATVTESAPRDAGPPPLGSWLMCEGRQIQLREGENIIGREPDAVVWLDSSTISRRHARIYIAGSRATLEDLGSKNGTQLRGTRLTMPIELADGDEIRFGSVGVTFRMPARPGSTVSLIQDI
jgi:DNA-binding winged helix-turn-helix (wHTH) protein